MSLNDHEFDAELAHELDYGLDYEPDYELDYEATLGLRRTCHGSTVRESAPLLTRLWNRKTFIGQSGTAVVKNYI